MTTSDKTRQKLVDSMRKTKVGSAQNQAPKRTVSKKKAAKKVQVENEPKHMSGQTMATNQQDNYQSSRRVWPD